MITMTALKQIWSFCSVNENLHDFLDMKKKWGQSNKQGQHHTRGANSAVCLDPNCKHAVLCDERELVATLSRPWTNRPVSYLKEESVLQRREHFLSAGVRKRQRVRTICRNTVRFISPLYTRRSLQKITLDYLSKALLTWFLWLGPLPEQEATLQH